MEMEKEKSLRFEGDLLPEHELINKIKDTLENVCNKLSALSSEPLDNALSDLDRDKKLPSILKLSFYIEEWANNHTHEERRRVQTENDSTREHLSSSQDERARRADGKILSMPTQKSIRYVLCSWILDPPYDGTADTDTHDCSHEERSDFHQESSNITASDHPLSLKGNEKKVSKTSSDELAQSTSASKSPISSPSRGPHAPAHGIVSFKPPAESRPRNTSPWYRFSDCILIKPNPLYPPHPGKPNSSSDAKYVRAFCSTMTLRVSLLATHMAVVQRISPTELVYPYIEFPGPRSSDDFKIPLPLPLPVTLEELFYGVTKKVTFSKVEISRQGNTLLSKIHLDVDVKAGMYAGKKLKSILDVDGQSAVCPL
ncbi:hypothetical protein N7507_011628 [Penicillium longicatenatum]|nr:hypothetical protein N7507_011628 [Penicillium longicatenatum]